LLCRVSYSRCRSANFLEDFVITPRQQFTGVRVGVGVLLAIANHPKYLGKGIGGGRHFGISGLVKTTALPGVTGHIPHLLHRHQQGVAVAIVADRPQALGMARGGPLVPEGLARTAPKPGFTGLEGFL
jgi:hypothetical protein